MPGNEEPIELFEKPEGETAKHPDVPERPKIRPAELTTVVDKAIQQVETELKIIPDAFGQASERFGVSAENLVVEPDKSKLATAKEQLASTEHQLQELSAVLASEPTLPNIEPQASVVDAGTAEPARVVETGPNVDGVKTPEPTFGLPTLPTVEEIKDDYQKRREAAAASPAEPEKALPFTSPSLSPVEEAPTFRFPALPPLEETTAKLPENPEKEPPFFPALPPLDEAPTVTLPPLPRSETSGPRIVLPDFSEPEDRVDGVRAPQPAEPRAEPTVKPVFGRIQPRRPEMRRPERKFARTLPIETEDDLPELADADVESPTEAEVNKAKNADRRKAVDKVFSARVSEAKADDRQKPKFKAGETIQLPKHFSVQNESAWTVAQVDRGHYILEQTSADGQTQHLVASETELAAQGAKPKELSKGEIQFKERVAQRQTRTPEMLKKEGEKKAFVTKVGDRLNLEKGIKVGEILRLPRKYSREDLPAWKVKQAEADVFLVEQVDEFGNVQELVVDRAMLDEEGIRKSRPENPKKPEPGIKQDAWKPTDYTKMDLSPDERAFFEAGDAANETGAVDYSKYDLTTLHTLRDSAQTELDRLIDLVDQKDPKTNRRVTEKDVRAQSHEVDRLDETIDHYNDPKPLTEKSAEKPAGQPRRLEQFEYYRTMFEAAMNNVMRNALQEAHNNPGDYAKLAGSVVGATMRYTADGGASLIDRQGQVVKELGKDKVDEARLTILKDRLVSDMLRYSIKFDAQIQQEVGLQEKRLNKLAGEGKTDSDEYKSLVEKIDVNKKTLKESEKWQADLDAGKGKFRITTEGGMELKGLSENSHIRIDQGTLERQNNIISLQTERLFSARTAIKELAESKAVPEEFKQDVQQGNFTFTVNDDMNIMVEMVGGKNDGYRFQVSSKITKGILNGSLPTGDVKPSVDQLHDQTDPGTEQEDDTQTTGDDEVTTSREEVAAAIRSRVEPKEKSTANEVTGASDAIRQRILDLGTSEYGAEVRPLIEGMQQMGAHNLAVRADAAGNIYVGVMDQIGNQMRRRLMPRIEADSVIGRLLNTDRSIGILRSPENTVIEVQPVAKPEARTKRPIERPTAERQTATPENRSARVKEQISDLVRGFGATIDPRERAKLIGLIGQLDRNDRLGTVVESIQNSSLSSHIDDAMEIINKSLNGSESDRAARELVPVAYQTAGYEQAVRLVNFIRGPRERDSAMRKLIDLNRAAG